MARAYVGTSGFAYREWRPSFYPEKTPEKAFLPYYAARFGAVEIDYTFYRMPNARTLDAWREATPDGFRFAIKASQKITHFERLKLPSESLAYLMGVLPRLGDRRDAKPPEKWAPTLRQMLNVLKEDLCKA